MRCCPATEAGRRHGWIKAPACGHITVDMSGTAIATTPVPAMVNGNGDVSSPDLEVEEELDQGLKGVNYLCKFCRRMITTSSERIVVNGQHVHICANPYGLLFEVGCFARAVGCQSTGTPTTEFTWFPGYAWSIALCSSCANHLGWYYMGRPPSEFYGLILSHLIEESSESS
ncbi:MAG: hypothetical protein K9J48_02555 [Desulfohalobiaceae bacterium]|nr:hypothetical protein [Desulfohalobiaceae bacterium]